MRRHSSRRPVKSRRHRTIRSKARAAPSRRASVADLQEQFNRLTGERDEAQEQQAATAEVLKVISRSAFDIQAVFEAVVESSARLCGADRAFIFRFDGELLRVAASVGVTQEHEDFVVQNPIRPGRDSASGRAVLERRAIHIPDVLADPEYTYGARIFGEVRTVLAVPILHDGAPIGAIVITRNEVGHFAERHVELLKTFADQAGIAIENTRLLNELRQRTSDLSESLEQQTATSEVLSSMSGSMTDTKPVFDAILHNLLRLFGTSYAVVHLLKDGMNYLAAFNGEPGFERLASHYPRPLDDSTVSGRAMLLKQVLQFAPLIDNPAAPPASARHAREHAYNSILSAPMARGDEVVGAIVTGRRDPRAFDDKQVALIKSFAAQAVIACV